MEASHAVSTHKLKSRTQGPTSSQTNNQRTGSKGVATRSLSGDDSDDPWKKRCVLSLGTGFSFL